MIFCSQMTSAIDRSPPLSAGCAKNYQQDICQCIWDTVVVTIDPCRDEINEHRERQGRSKEGNGIRSSKI